MVDGWIVSGRLNDSLDQLLGFRSRNKRPLVAKKNAPGEFHRAEQMLKRFALAAAPDQFAQWRQFRFHQGPVELEIKFDAFALKRVRKQCSAFKRGLSISRFLK